VFCSELDISCRIPSPPWHSHGTTPLSWLSRGVGCFSWSIGPGDVSIDIRTAGGVGCSAPLVAARQEFAVAVRLCPPPSKVWVSAAKRWTYSRGLRCCNTPNGRYQQMQEERRYKSTEFLCGCAGGRFCVFPERVAEPGGWSRGGTRKHVFLRSEDDAP